MVDDTTRDALLRLLSRGEITMAEAGRFAGASRVTVLRWCSTRGVDPVKARRGYVLRQCQKAVRRAVRSS